jgi:hypothetical protein
MSISINCSIDLTEEELFLILQHRRAIVTPRFIEPKSVESKVTTIAPEPEVTPEARIDEDYPATEGIPPPRLPKAPRRAKTNGAEAPINATPLAPPPPPEPLDEPAMRSLLSKVGAVHPLKVKAITDLLEAHGGKRRLSECDPATWPAIAEAALVALKEHSA